MNKVSCLLLAVALSATAPLCVRGEALPYLTLDNMSVSFSYVGGGAVPLPRTVKVGSTGATFSFALAMPSAGWARVTTNSGTAPARLTITVDPTGLAAGQYSTQFTVTGQGTANGTHTVRIALAVAATSASHAVVLSALPGSLALTADSSSKARVSQIVAISSNVAGSRFTASVAPGSSWLQVSPANGVTSANLTVVATTANLSPGNYSGAITVSGDSGAPLSIPVALSIATAGSGDQDKGPVTNSIQLSGSAGTSRPYTISRVFKQGEIKRYAQARVGGQGIATQCDVKTRWPDGSVQHAMVSFWAGAMGPATVDFVEQATGNNAGPLTGPQMLSASYLFGAQMELASGGTVLSANARQMLAAGSFRYWLQGSIATQVIIEDRTPASVYDLGFGPVKSFHPMFVATFYPGWQGVQVDLVGENDWTTRMSDLSYTLTLRTGNPLSNTAVYSKALTQGARSRWRKTFWSGPQPPAVNIDYNLAYLVASQVLPNFDLSKKVSAAAIAGEVGSFNATDKGEIGGSAQWQKNFSTTGGRPDIGLLPRWYVRYLYTFDPGLYQVMLGNAAASGNIPIHYRESLTGRPFNLARQADAFGYPLSINARPSVRPLDSEQGDTTPADKITPGGPIAGGGGGWNVDLAHQASFAFVPYLITGDYYDLEEMYFWASYNLAKPNPDSTVYYGRHSDWGYLNPADVEMRGTAWSLRTVAHAAFFAPDGSPEKLYYTEKVSNNLAVWEGVLSVTDGSFYDPSPNSKWSYGRNGVVSGMANPLHYFGPANVEVQTPVDASKVQLGDQPWMYHFNLVVLGHMKELGFPAAKAQDGAAKFLIEEIRNPAYNPYLAGAYYMGVARQPDGLFFQDWGALKNAFTPDYLNRASRGWPEMDDGDVEHGYPHIARAAASFGTKTTDGTLSGLDTWNWINANVGYQDLLNDNPKWAFLPR